MATARYCDLLQQGFMKPKRRTINRQSGFEIAASIAAETGENVEWIRGRYVVQHPNGHSNYLKSQREARNLALAQAADKSR